MDTRNELINRLEGLNIGTFDTDHMSEKYLSGMIDELSAANINLENSDDVDRMAQIVNKWEAKNAASMLGKLGGSVKSPRKAETSAQNGKLGGRPKTAY
jgi:hypothetical protein